MTSNCCAACGRPFRKAKPAPEWQRQHDLKRYEAAMKEAGARAQIWADPAKAETRIQKLIDHPQR
jgi:hypothetical protein